MEIKGFSLSNMNISAIPPYCATPEFPPTGLSAPFYAGLEYYQEYLIANTTTVTVTGLPTGVTYSTTQEGDSVRLTFTGVPTTGSQAITMNANAISSGAYCLAVANVKDITPTTSNIVIGPITSNLVQWIDMGNGQVYSGWGNTIQNRQSANLDYYVVNAADSNARANATVEFTNGGALRSNGATIGRIFATTWDGTNANPIANTGAANWTLESWFKLDDYVSNYANTNKLTLVGEKWGGALNNDVHHYLTFEKTDGSGADNVLKGGSYSAAYYVASNTVASTIYPGQYYHAAITSAGGTVRRLYINGVLANTLTTSAITAASDLETRIGADVSVDAPNANGILRGTVAVTRYYNKTLSATEITQNYNSEVGRFTGGSYSFNGANSVATFLANTTQFNTNTGDYTYEFWYKSNTEANSGAPQPIWDSSAHKIFFENNTGNANAGHLTVATGNTAITANISRLYQNNWTHFAVSRIANVTRIFMNGLMQKYSTDTSNANTNANSYMGFANISNSVLVNNSTPSGNFYLAGTITNFLFNANTGYYTNSGYTRPSLPTSAANSASNVKLLLKASDSVGYQMDSSPRVYAQNTTVWTNVVFSNSTPFAQPDYSSILRQAQFTYTGDIQTWTVPNNVSTITVTATGARGGGGGGGNGCAAATTLSVTAGQTLYIVVGGWSNGQTAAYGYGGSGGSGNDNQDGGAGGGLSGIFTTSVPSIANALFVVGGGGGGTGLAGSILGGSAGFGSPGSGTAANQPQGGGGGTTSAGGSAGNVIASASVPPTAGNDIQGGTGGSRVASFSYGGGGGGGGYYGGGGGGGGFGSDINSNRPGGGGGGATWSSNTVTYIAPFDLNGNGVVIINYTGLTAL
jgi:hypothetical protein